MPVRPATFKPKWMGQRPQRNTHTARLYDQRRGSAHSRGYNGTWDDLRAYLKRQPEMAFCDCGCGQPTECFDHIDAVDGPTDPGFFDVRNIAPLTNKCHTRKTIRFDGGYGKKRDESAEGRAYMDAMRQRARERAEKMEARA